MDVWRDWDGMSRLGSVDIRLCAQEQMVAEQYFAELKRDAGLPLTDDEKDAAAGLGLGFEGVAMDVGGAALPAARTKLSASQSLGALDAEELNPLVPAADAGIAVRTRVLALLRSCGAVAETATGRRKGAGAGSGSDGKDIVECIWEQTSAKTAGEKSAMAVAPGKGSVFDDGFDLCAAVAGAPPAGLLSRFDVYCGLIRAIPLGFASVRENASRVLVDNCVDCCRAAKADDSESECLGRFLWRFWTAAVSAFDPECECLAVDLLCMFCASLDFALEIDSVELLEKRIVSAWTTVVDSDEPLATSALAEVLKFVVKDSSFAKGIAVDHCSLHWTVSRLMGSHATVMRVSASGSGDGECLCAVARETAQVIEWFNVRIVPHYAKVLAPLRFGVECQRIAASVYIVSGPELEGSAYVPFLEMVKSAKMGEALIGELRSLLVLMTCFGVDDFAGFLSCVGVEIGGNRFMLLPFYDLTAHVRKSRRGILPLTDSRRAALRKLLSTFVAKFSTHCALAGAYDMDDVQRRFAKESARLRRF